MSSTKSYYHRSKVSLQIGTVLCGRGLPRNVAEIEDAFETHRPTHCLNRRSAVFMSDHRDIGLHGVEGDYVYQLEPLGMVEQYDNSWYGIVQKAHLKKKYFGTPQERMFKTYPDWTSDLLAQCAKAYWDCLASSNPNWEYLVPEAQVVELVHL
ncbi:hypothetical protein AB4072_11120 [Microvirga sp. 2MCAF38]|uniref:hypothetical protein n=1 Tax=Microvirga sp. 2MCAF38 TaxID=3232989 RepID=UPI003F956613